MELFVDQVNFIDEVLELSISASDIDEYPHNHIHIEVPPGSIGYLLGLFFLFCIWKEYNHVKHEKPEDLWPDS